MNPKLQYIAWAATTDVLPLFFQPWYLDAVCASGQWDVAIAKSEGRIVAVLPYFIKAKWPFRYITMPHLCKMMGPFILPPFRAARQTQEWTEQLLNQIPKVHYYYQQLHYDVLDWRAYQRGEYQQQTGYSYVLEPLNPLEKVFQNISASYRNNKIKRARKVVQVVSEPNLRACYQLNLKTFERQGLPFPFSFAFFQHFDQALARHQARKMFFAIDQDGQYHSTLYLIWDHQSAYYLLSGDDPDHRSSGAGILLVWEAIQFTQKELGLNRFDFLGSMIPSIEHVRRQFGAHQLPYFKIWKYHSRLFKWLEHING